jgi:hypothetical protein
MMGRNQKLDDLKNTTVLPTVGAMVQYTVGAVLQHIHETLSQSAFVGRC